MNDKKLAKLLLENIGYKMRDRLIQYELNNDADSLIEDLINIMFKELLKLKNEG